MLRWSEPTTTTKKIVPVISYLKTASDEENKME